MVKWYGQSHVKRRDERHVLRGMAYAPVTERDGEENRSAGEQIRVAEILFVGGGCHGQDKIEERRSTLLRRRQMMGHRREEKDARYRGIFNLKCRDSNQYLPYWACAPAFWYKSLCESVFTAL